MQPRKKQPAAEKTAHILADAKRGREQRAEGYRERALALFPHVCARCGREFSGKTLRELTVHHKDHDHSNNPPDGGNWELLCLYCHDNEHEEQTQRAHYDGVPPDSSPEPSMGFQPFEGLKGLLKPDKNETGPSQ